MTILRVVSGVAGAVVVAIGLYDMFATTVAVSVGKGPVTTRVAGRVWRMFFAVHRRTRRHRLLAWGGPVTLLAVMFVWLVLLVFGWALVFASSGAASTSAGTEAAVFVDHVFFAASLVLGRGSAPYELTGQSWALAQRITGLSGVVLLSLSIAYVLPVVNAVVDKRKVASYISTLGHTPEQVLGRAWNGTDFGILRLHLVPLAAMVTEVAEKHMAYPVAHYFHSVERHTAFGPSVAVLDDTLTILECCEDTDRMEPSTVVPLRAAVTEFLDTLQAAFITASDEVGPAPDIGSLRDQGLPLLDDETCAEGFDRVARRRRLLRALLEHDGWSWEGLSKGSWQEAAMFGRDQAVDTHDVQDEPASL